MDRWHWGQASLPFLRGGVSRSSLSDTRPLTANEKDPSAPLGMTIREEHFSSAHFIRYSGYPSPTLSFRAQREIFLARRCSLLLSLKVSHFPLSHIERYTSVQERSLDFARDDDTEKTHFPHTLCMIQRISIPYTVISSAARNLPCTPSFLAPFAKGFPFSAIPHTALYRCARKIPPLRSGWQWGWRSALVIFMPPRQRVPLRGTLIQAFGLPLL